MRLALFQGAPRRGDIAGNLATIRAVASAAAGDGVDLVVFPECYLAGYYNPDRVEALAVDGADATMRALCAVAADAGTAIVCGLYELRGAAVANAAVLVGPDGAHLTTYRKTHLFGPWEQANFAPGGAGEVVTLGGIKLGLMICYDIEFPEPARRLARAGAELIVVPTALMAPAGVIPTVLVPARAAENQVFVAYANRIGAEDHLHFVGQSCIVGPDGGVLARADERSETLLVADIEAGAIGREHR